MACASVSGPGSLWCRRRGRPGLALSKSATPVARRSPIGCVSWPWAALGAAWLRGLAVAVAELAGCWADEAGSPRGTAIPGSSQLGRAWGVGSAAHSETLAPPPLWIPPATSWPGMQGGSCGGSSDPRQGPVRALATRQARGRLGGLGIRSCSRLRLNTWALRSAATRGAAAARAARSSDSADVAIPRRAHGSAGAGREPAAMCIEPRTARHRRRPRWTLAPLARAAP